MYDGKDFLEHLDFQEQTATDLCVEVGILRRCTMHENIYDPLAGDDSQAYKLGNWRRKHKKDDCDRIFGSNAELVAAVQRAKDSAPGEECADCSYYFARD